MDSEKYIINNDELEQKMDGIVYIDGIDDDICDILSYVDITRELQEKYQWYDIFNYNLESLYYWIDNEELIPVNANLISLVSAGKNLIESADFCIKHFCEKETYNYFKDQYITGEYDGNFSYRFLMRGRNFSQHNHIPVSCDQNGFCFDLMQIYNTPHYRFNSALKKYVEKLMDDITSKTGGNPLLALQPTVTLYVCSVYKIYREFLEIMRDELHTRRENCFMIIRSNPDLIEQRNNRKYEGFLFYTVPDDDGMLHTFDTRRDYAEEILAKRIDDVVNDEKRINTLMEEIEWRSKKI